MTFKFEQIRTNQIFCSRFLVDTFLSPVSFIIAASGPTEFIV